MHQNRRLYDNDPEIADSFAQCPRFDKHELTDDQIEEIAERAAKKALQMAEDAMYQTVGKKAVNAVFWVIGVLAVGGVIFAAKMGWVKL